MINTYDYLIIGGGIAGLSISALLEKEKANSILLESHSLLGGCASFYKRNGYVFDVGATTLSGLKENRPFDKFLKEIDLNLETVKVDPGIISCFDQFSIRHFSETQKLVEEFRSKFQNIDPDKIRNFLINMQKIEIDGYDAIANNFLPLRNLSNLPSMIKFSNLKFSSLIPLLFSSFEEYLLKHELSDQLIKKMYDELLFITAQNYSSDTPALFGILGANYPSDTHYHLGGMQGLINKLKTKTGPIKTNHKVLKITKEGELFKVDTNKGSFYSKKVISTLPLKNNLSLLNLEQNKSDLKENFSAFTIYFTVPLNENLESIYFQVHSKSLPFANTHSYFVSFSHPKDFERNISNRQTVTISTHILPSKFEKLNQLEYQKIKTDLSEKILEHFCQKFNFAREQISNIEIGTPKTFERYTSRHNGAVGGLGHSLGRSLKEMIYHQEIVKNFFEIGDNVFPGQGIAAVIYGAMSLKKNL